MTKPIYGCCRLCNLKDRLVDSHIIPNFYFKSLKEVEGFYYVQSTDPLKREFKKQKGITENLFCAKCDNVRLQRNEDHLAKVLFGGCLTSFREVGRLFVVKDYDYKKVKNGLLSILWRMSLAKDRFFSEVDLGPKHEERLRLALLNDIELAEEDYPILVTAPFFGGKDLGNMMIPPDFTRTDGNRVYRCIISGLLFTFFVGAAPIGHSSRQLILRRNSWPIIRAKVEEIPFLFDACKQLAKANLARQNTGRD